MKLMEIAESYVKGNAPVYGPDIVKHFECLGYNWHQAAGAVGSARKFGLIDVCGKKKKNGRDVNIFD